VADIRDGVVHTDFRARAAETMTWVTRGRIGSNVRGPLLTVGLVISFDLLARHGFRVEHPFTFLILTIVYAAGTAGVRSGLVSAVVSVVYAVHFLSEPGAVLTYRPAHAYSLVALAVLMPATAVFVAQFRAGELRARRAALTHDEIVALERRLSFFAEAYRVLASSLDYERTLRDLARISVPACADWCLIHLVNDQGDAQFIAGAHRDATRDLLVRALGEYDAKRLPFGQPAAWSGLLTVTEAELERLAPSDDQRKLHRTLAPSMVIQTPMYARDRVVGVITFGLSRGSARSYQLDDLRDAEELAGRAALAVDNARLHRDAEGAEERSRLLFEGNPQPMWIFDVETLEFLAVNDAALRHYGYTQDEMLAMTVIDLRPPEDVPALSPDFDYGGSRRREVALAQHQRKDGTIVEMELASHEFDLAGRRVRLVLATDVTERARTHAALRRSEEQLRQVQWMDAAGRLAGGVAHDFNNLLTTIRGFSDMLLKDLPSEGGHYKDVVQIKTAADRGAQLARQLLAFGQQQTLQPRRLDLNQVITTMEALLQRLIGVDIRLVTQLQAGVGEVFMDPSQLEQVLVNLVLNAREAMPSGGTITLATYERRVGRAGRVRNLRPGDYLVLAVSDTGTGIDGEALQHIFKPFFPAKPQGQRAGLGMAVVYGIVRQSGGAIRVSSEPDRGTTIKIYLPRLAVSDQEEPAAIPEALRGTETILVAEDEEGVRELVRRIFVDHGYTVLAARHGRDALLIAERYQKPIHLLVTDIVMPELDGTHLAAQLQSRLPGLKVLYISGYTNDEVVRRGVSRTTAAFLQKPFTTDDLMLKVRGVLDGELGPAQQS
jgi:two-component system cell cycle sensor histidine kinase/response regulator CckA